MIDQEQIENWRKWRVFGQHLYVDDEISGRVIMIHKDEWPDMIVEMCGVLKNAR